MVSTQIKVSPRFQFWLVLVAIILLAFNMRSPIVALGSIAPVVQEVLGISGSQIGWLGALPMLMFALGALISPAVGKRFGLENTLIVMIVIMTLGMVVRSAVASWSWFLSGTLLLSLAIGFANTLAAPIIKQRTPDHIALVTGAFSLSMTVMAGLVAGLVLPLSNYVGWQWAMGGWSILGLVTVGVWVFLRLYLGEFVESDKQGQNFQENTSTKIQENHHHQTKHSMWKTPLAWQIAIFLGLQSLLFYTVASFLPSIWLSKGLTAVQAGRMATVFQFMAPMAILSLTWLVRRGKSIQVIAVVAGLFNVAGVVGMAWLSVDLAWLWSALMGLGSSCIFTLSIMLFSMRTHTANQASELSGMSQTVGYIIAFFGPLGAGWLYDLSHSWQLPLTILTVLMVINMVFGYFASRPIMIDGKPA